MTKSEAHEIAQLKYRIAVAAAWRANREANIARVRAVNAAERERNAEWKRIEHA